MRKGPCKSLSSTTEPATEASLTTSSLLISPALELCGNSAGSVCAGSSGRSSGTLDIARDSLGGVSETDTPCIETCVDSVSRSFLKPLAYSSGLFFHVKARGAIVTRLESAPADCARLEMLGLMYPVVGVSSLEGRAAWPRR